MRFHKHKWATYDIAEWDDKPTVITQRCEKCPAERQLLEGVMKQAIPNPTTPAGDNEFVPLEVLEAERNKLKE